MKHFNNQTLKFIIVATLVIISTTTPFAKAQAQDANHAVGLRGGYTSGLSYRTYIGPEDSYRFLLSGRHDGLQLTALREFHRYQLFDFSDDLNLVFGAGAHAGYTKSDDYYWDGGVLIRRDRDTHAVLGADGLIGLEYNFWEAPISIGLETKPFVELFGEDNFRVKLFDIGLTIRFKFN
ncbi:hypothetical protein EYV94_22560 [Puteibacter caeruleilacunae]|nr:hypothetical protein EYV94_22560 [Puteibacter caeruleilacunae]